MVRERASIQRTPRPRGLRRSREDVVDAVAGDVHEARSRRHARVEVAAEHDGRARRPVARRRGGERDVGLRARLGVRLGVEVADPPAALQAHAVHHPPLGPRAQRAQPMLGHALAAHEDRVGAAAPGLDDVRAPPRERARERQQPVARGERGARARPAGAAQRRRPPRRHLLQQRDVPLPAGESRGEVGQQVARRVGDRAPVEEVPGQHQHRDVSSPPCRVTSSPAPS